MNETNVKVSFSNSVTNAKKLDTYAEKLKEIYSILSAIDRGKLAQLGEFNITLTKVKENTKEIDEQTSKFAKNFNTAFNIGKIVLFTKKMFALIKTMYNAVQVSSNYVENINLLEVAYANIDKKTGEFNEDIKETSLRIEKLVNNMAEIYGLDESRLAKSFGIFKQLANAMELPSETAEDLSELMVKMSNDISSLYNLDLDRASNALQSALAGQVRPIRTATGADITEKTLQKTVDALGLDTTINKLSFVEKRLIMVISLTEQLRNSQGDYGRTIESVANQTRIMGEQWERLTRAIGNVFYPMLEKILPYLNAILMVLTEIFNFIASLLGFKMPEFDYSGLAGTSDVVAELEENLEGASSSVDKLKQKLSGLRSFDKLNVITTPKDTSTGTGSGGIDQRILDAFKRASSEYNDMMDKVKLKANEIRDSMLEWLGFEKKFNEDGSTSWVFKEIKPGTIIGALAIGSPFVLGVTAILTGFKKIGETPFFKTLMKSKIVNLLLTIGGIAFSFDATKKILDNDTTWGTIFEGLGGSAMLAYGTWNLTHSVTVTLAVTAVSLVPQAYGVIKKGWNSLLKDVDNYIGNGDGKTTFKEYVDAWVGGMEDYIIPAIKKFFANLWDEFKTEVESLLNWYSNSSLGKFFRKIAGVDIDLTENKKTDAGFNKGGSGRSLGNSDIVEEMSNGISDGITDGLQNIKDNKALNYGREIGKELKKGIEENQPTITLKGKVSPVRDAITTAFDKMMNVASSALSIIGISPSIVKALKNIKLYAGGGMLPNKGNLFMMNEKEPELLGTIGGKSFVANQNQMMDLLDKKIGNAQQKPINATFVIQVGDKELARQVINDLQDIAKTDGKPITIGG